MKRINIYLLATIVFLLLIALPAYAQSPKITGYKTGNVTVNKSYSYRTVILDQSLEAAQESKSRVLEFGYKVDLDYIFKWEISTLMGEPVVVGWLAYKPTSISPYNSALFSPMFGNKDELFKKVRISEFKMEIVFFKNIKGQRAMERGAARVFDIGVAWIPFLGYSRDELMNDESLYKKFRSYNVPGSPDWNDLFNNIKNAQQAKQYFTDFTTTKRHIKPSPSDFKIVKVDIDTSEIDKYIYEYLQEIERNIVQEKTAGPKQEKALLEAKVARERQEMAAQMARQEEIDKASYAQKSFEDQLDDLLEEVEETDSAQDSALQMNHDKENARINFLANKIRETTNPLGKYSDENLREIYSNFDNRKIEVENLPSAMGKGEIEIFGYPGKRGAKFKGTDIVIIEPNYEEICCGESQCLLGNDSYTIGYGLYYYPVVSLVNFNNEVISEYKEVRTTSLHGSLKCFKHYAHIETGGNYSDKIIDLGTGKIIKDFHYKDGIDRIFIKNGTACIDGDDSFLYDVENNYKKWDFSEGIKCGNWLNDHLLYVYDDDSYSNKGYIFDILKQKQVSELYDSCRSFNGEIYCRKEMGYYEDDDYFKINGDFEGLKVDNPY